MFSLSVMLGAGQFRLMYKTEEAALRSAATIDSSTLPMSTGNFFVQDDFGQRLNGKHTSVHGYLLEDMDQSKIAAVELAIGNAHIQQMAMKRAQSDPALRSNLATPSSPILSPMGNGRMG